MRNHTPATSFFGTPLTQVKTVLRDGLLLGFLGFFTGSVDPLHMAPGAKMPTEGAKLRVGQVFCVSGPGHVQSLGGLVGGWVCIGAAVRDWFQVAR